jgi:adenylate kinase
MATSKMIIQVGEDVIEASDEMKNYILTTQKEIQDMETQRIAKEDTSKQAILSKLNITADEAKFLGL